MEALRAVAAEAGDSPARVALAWVLGRPGITAALMGVSRVEQVADNVAALDVRLSSEHRAALDAASASKEAKLYALFAPTLRQHVTFGGATVRGWVRLRAGREN